MSTRNVAIIVVDLGFGDAGKGLLTDYLVRTHAAGLVVRFNGGAQAGHNVVTADGRQHTFSQLGAGSFVPGVRTHLARDVVVHPTALTVEAAHLARLGEPGALSRLSIDPACRVTTPFQQAANRVRELARDAARHGSCGVGFGETVSDSGSMPELSVKFGELLHAERLRDRLYAQRDAKRRELEQLLGVRASSELQRELDTFRDATLIERWLEAAGAVARQVRCVRDEALGSERAPLVFEGAQGVLLDERFGFHPHTTFSRTTFDGARDVLERCGFDGDVQRVGVVRSYAVRHGAGPLPTEDATLSARTREPHNEAGPWQAHVRKGWLDLMLLDYALRAARGVDALCLTHLDSLRELPDFQHCSGYDGPTALPLPACRSEQERLTAELTAARPRYREGPHLPEGLCALLEHASGAPVRYASYGPTAGDVVSRSSVESQR